MKLRTGLVVVGAVASIFTADASADTISGSGAADVLIGTPSPDILFGREGNDRIVGRAGNDLLSGGRGLDTLVCGPGLDAVLADRGDVIDSSCELVASASRLRLRSAEQSSTTTPSGGDAPSGPDGSGAGNGTDSGGSDGGGSQAADSGAEDQILLAWLFLPEGDPDWTEGVVLFLLGVVGALVTTYLFLGDFLPSMGGKADYESARLDLKARLTKRDDLQAERQKIAGETPFPADRIEALDRMSTDLTTEISDIRDGMSSERWRLVLLGIPIYVLLGGAFATVLATSLPEALLIGFGWVAVADRLGLKREQQVREDIRGKEIGTLETEADTRTEEAVKAQEALRALEEDFEALEGDYEQLADEHNTLEVKLKAVGDANAELASYRLAADRLADKVDVMQLGNRSTSERQPGN